MSTAIPFFKLHGFANDFVLIDARTEAKTPARHPTKVEIRAIADRKRGVGFDQLLLLESSTRVHAKLVIYNADASKAEMCGNGLRAAALYLWMQKHSDRELVFETDAGDRRARRLGPIQKDHARIECEMGVPHLKALPKAIAKGARLGSKIEKPVLVDVGNPHAVFFAWPKNDQKLTEWGSLVENHKAFPKRTNVEFVRVKNRHAIEVQVWERGVGITEACGTGAVASAVAALAQGLVESPVEVRFRGGVAEVSWDPQTKNTSAFLRGDASFVFSGAWT